MSQTMIYTAPECSVCCRASEVELDRKAYAAWRAGTHVQDAFPDMTADQREVLISGTHGPCWDELFRGE